MIDESFPSMGNPIMPHEVEMGGGGGSSGKEPMTSTQDFERQNVEANDLLHAARRQHNTTLKNRIKAFRQGDMD